MEDLALQLLALIADEDGISINKAAKKSELSMSELLRLLALLGDNPQLGGLDLITRREQSGRDCLYLTEKGRMLCQSD